MLTSVGIKKKYSGVESHNALEAGEIYDEYLPQIFKNVREATPQLFERRISINVCTYYEQHSRTKWLFSYSFGVRNRSLNAH